MAFFLAWKCMFLLEMWLSLPYLWKMYGYYVACYNRIGASNYGSWIFSEWALYNSNLLDQKHAVIKPFPVPKLPQNDFTKTGQESIL